MSLLQKYLHDETGRVLAEFGLMAVVGVTLCLVGITAARGDAQTGSATQTIASNF